MRKMLLIILFSGINFSFSQGVIGNNVQGIKIAYMTRELKLSSDEAEKFWPIYYDYNDDLNSVRKQYKDNIVVLDEKIAETRRKYYQEFKKILNTEERANKVFLADRDFNIFIKKEMEERQRLRNERLITP